jgi:hypothetical protein
MIMIFSACVVTSLLPVALHHIITTLTWDTFVTIVAFVIALIALVMSSSLISVLMQYFKNDCLDFCEIQYGHNAIDAQSKNHTF